MKRSKLSFSSEFIKVELIESCEELLLLNESIIVNTSDSPLVADNEKLYKFKSSIYKNISIKGDKFIKITSLTNPTESSFPHRKSIRDNWTLAHKLTSLSRHEGIDFWRSKKERIGKAKFNLWYAKEGTNCGIHKKHNFQESHVQIHGIGIMQKFHENNYDSLYESVYMAPGLTHKEFYNSSLEYPWHQYNAITDCIWLAIEEYED